MTTLPLLVAGLPVPLPAIARAIADGGGRGFLVGGAVRDHLLGGALPKDFDCEVFGLAPERLESLLAGFGKVLMVGKSFGVFKLGGATTEFDFSLPRRDRKIGKGHKGFAVVTDPAMDFAEAASRRDFTINAMGMDLLTGEILDPWGGRRDLEAGILRHVGPAFAEDPLRVYRAMQFVARFELTMDPATVALARSLDLGEIARERIFEEFKKLLLKAERPALGLAAAQELGILAEMPELAALIGIPQDPIWHPEGDVWAHTLLTVDQAAKMREGDELRDLGFMLGALCHDFGKPSTTEWREGRWRSFNHSQEGIEPTRAFLNRLTEQRDLIEVVLNYVREHLQPSLLYQQRGEVKDGAIRRLALRIAIPDLVRLAAADYFGSHPDPECPGEYPAGRWLLEKASRLVVAAGTKPQSLLRGRDLLALGMVPGPAVGEMVRQAFELQLDGRLTDYNAALTWAEAELRSGIGAVG